MEKLLAMSPEELRQYARAMALSRRIPMTMRNAAD
jgi:hypothetical protein